VSFRHLLLVGVLCLSAVTSAAADDGAASVTSAADRVTIPSRRILLAFTGDTLPHSPLVDQAARSAATAGRGERYDFRPMFEAVAPILRSVDLAVCHLETPVAAPGRAWQPAPVYGVPAEVAEGIAFAGFDRCSTASNHTMDQGVLGVDVTLQALEGAGVSAAGTARTPSEAVEPVFEVQGVRFAHLSYTYGFNGAGPPAGEWWRANVIDPARIIADAADARARGAQVVVVSLHWGTEGQWVPSAGQRVVAAQLTASGQIDLIVGHHVHLLQPIEQVNGRWVVFGMGNFLSNMPTGDHWGPPSQDGAIVVVPITVEVGGQPTIGTPSVIPTWVDRDNGWVIRAVMSDLADPTLTPARRAVLEASLARTRAVVGAFVPAG
jgi:Bacterial capsule synthesis protein PGA_cap